MCNTSREEQSEVGHLSYLETCAAVDDLSRRQKRGVSSKAGAKQSFEIQNSLRFWGRKEEPKKTQLRDTNSRSHGPHLECVVAQRPYPIQGVSEGLCPTSLGEQTVRPIVRNSQTAQRIKCKGMFAKKNGGMVNPSCAVSQECEVIAIEEKGLSRDDPNTNARMQRGQQNKAGIE